MITFTVACAIGMAIGFALRGAWDAARERKREAEAAAYMEQIAPHIERLRAEMREAQARGRRRGPLHPSTLLPPPPPDPQKEK